MRTHLFHAYATLTPKDRLEKTLLTCIVLLYACIPIISFAFDFGVVGNSLFWVALFFWSMLVSVGVYSVRNNIARLIDRIAMLLFGKKLLSLRSVQATRTSHDEQSRTYSESSLEASSRPYFSDTFEAVRRTHTSDMQPVTRIQYPIRTAPSLSHGEVPQRAAPHQQSQSDTQHTAVYPSSLFIAERQQRKVSKIARELERLERMEAANATAALARQETIQKRHAETSVWHAENHDALAVLRRAQRAVIRSGNVQNAHGVYGQKHQEQKHHEHTEQQDVRTTHSIDSVHVTSPAHTVNQVQSTHISQSQPHAVPHTADTSHHSTHTSKSVVRSIEEKPVEKLNHEHHINHQDIHSTDAQLKGSVRTKDVLELTTVDGNPVMILTRSVVH
jgi:hypothetical protein